MWVEMDVGDLERGDQNHMGVTGQMKLANRGDRSRAVEDLGRGRGRFREDLLV